MRFLPTHAARVMIACLQMKPLGSMLVEPMRVKRCLAKSNFRCLADSSLSLSGKKIRGAGLLVLVLAGGLLRAADLSPSREGLELFEKKIQPILTETCYKCHSHDADKIKGGLLLDSHEAALKGGDTGPALVPGKPEESLLIKAIRYTDPDLQMPPKGKKLSDEQISALTEWVKLGAPRPPPIATDRLNRRRSTADDKKWWVFQPVRKPSVPGVKNSRWPA